LRLGRALSFCLTILATGFQCFDAHLDPADQRTLWHVAGAGWSTPAFDSVSVFFPGRNHDVVAVDKLSGVERWRVRLPYVPTCFPPDSATVGFSSIVAGGSLVTMDDGLIALDPATGAVRWTFHPPVGCMAGTSWPGSDGISLYAGASRGSVYAIDGAAGTLLWRGQFLSDSAAVAYSPVADGGTVYAEFNIQVANPPFDSGGVVALDAMTGATRWIRYFPRTASPCSPSGVRRVALSGSRVIAPSDDGTIYGLDAASGAVTWSSPRIDSTQNCDDRWVAAASGRVFAGANNGRIVALNAMTGQVLWRSGSGGTVANIDADSQNVYGWIGYSSLVARAAGTGRVLWSVGLGTGSDGVGVVTLPAIDADRLYAGASDGYYAYRK
jgi:outer membrane protein assembly factor BamB